mmetsp:Transcript_9936/g.25605  ORF Transcript_9936/g.25605 Transcript_9936/m.25605 type:complete len:145 (-) Transcript_9936:333-767(-)
MTDRVVLSGPAAALQFSATQARWVDIADTGGPLDSMGQAAAPYRNVLAPLAVIPENGTIDVASTPSIPEEAPFDPPSAWSSIRRGISPAAAAELKDWASIETKLECFARDLDVSPWSTVSSTKSSDASCGAVPGAGLMRVRRNA